MSDHPQYGKVIITENYHEGSVTGVKYEHEVSLLTDRQSLLKDVIEALSVITRGETHHLEMTVLLDKDNRMRLVRRWTV